MAIKGEAEEIRHFAVLDSPREPSIAIASEITVSSLHLYARMSKALERVGCQNKKGQPEKAASNVCPEIPPPLFPRRPRLLALPPCCPPCFMIDASVVKWRVLTPLSALADLCLLFGSATLRVGFILPQTPWLVEFRPLLLGGMQLSSMAHYSFSVMWMGHVDMMADLRG